MRLDNLPNCEKPREKAIREGINTLSNAELLAIMLHTGTRNQSVIDFAYSILAQFNGLEGLSRSSYQELIKMKGLKEAKAMSLLAMIEFAKRVNYQPSSQLELNSPEQIYEFLEPKLKSEFQEKCLVICLNNRNCLIRAVELFKGGLSQHIVHPRDIFREAVRENAARIILVHNHPSGCANPSVADIETTKALALLGKELGIPVLDHIIIGKGEYFSLKSNKLF